jgi:hypothetical protein
MMLCSRDEYLLQLHDQVEAAKARLERLRYRTPEHPQEEVLLQFLTRATELGEGCLLLGHARLTVPLLVLMRVLTETLFSIYWASLSGSNAKMYADGELSDLARMARLNLEKGRMKVRDCSSGEDRTASVLPDIQQLEKPKLKIEQIARDSGLGKVYDILYRFGSIEVHGLASWSKDKDAAVTALPAVSVLLQAILLIASNRLLSNRPTTPIEIFRILGIEHVGSE